MAPINVMAVRNWLKSQYPNPDINPEWVSTTVAALAEQDPTLDLRGMFFAIQTQLLLSNLEQSLLQYPLTPPIPGKLTTLPADPTVVHDVVLFGPEKKDACLVQIISISEVGHSAFQTKNTMEQRKEALSGVGRIRRIRDHAEPSNSNNNVNGDQPPDEEDNEPDDVPPYPRSMLMLDVSDGFRVMRAMEYRRIDALKLGETSLGSKLLLRNVPVRRGMLLLAPENTEYKGHMVEEFEDLQPILFQNGLLRRMGKPELPVELEPMPEPQLQEAPASDFDVDVDDAFMMDASVAHELDRVEAAASQASQSQIQALTLSRAAVSAAVPTTPARAAPTARQAQVGGRTNSGPAARPAARPPATSSVNAAINLIDLDKSDDLVDPLDDAELDWDAIDEVERSFSQSQSQNNSTRTNPGPVMVSATAPGASSRSIISIRSDTSEHARATSQSQARSKARSQGPLLVSEDETSEDE